MIGADCGKLLIFAETPIDPIELETDTGTLLIVGIACDITVNVTQNIKQTIKKGEYVDLASLLTINQHHNSKQ
jgi:hypothetical protein